MSLEDVIVKPVNSLIDQSHHASEAKLAVNGDGFGFAWYSDTRQLGLYKDVLPAWADGNLLSLASMIKSELFIAHVRASTFGQVSRSNCHPFTSGSWSFAHNGQIADFENCRRQLEIKLTDHRYVQRVGNTDSELMFLLLLDHGLDENVQSACKSVLQLVKHTSAGSKKATRVAAVFSNGDTLYALRYSTDSKSPSLYYCESENNGTMIASEPLDGDSDKWRTIPEQSLFSVNDSGITCHTFES
ncbi:MAG: class II glutamine amidotransferase [Granulosicoccus sp.]